MRNSFTHAGIVAACMMLAGPAQAGESLRAVGYVSPTDAMMTQARVWVDAINRGLKGEIEIDFAGGPNAIPRDRQIAALRDGRLDIAIAVTADYRDQVPEAGALTLSRLSPSQERKSGFYDAMVRAHGEIDVRYIGRVRYSPFFLWIGKKVGTLAGLEGLRMRSEPLYDRFVRRLGMVPVMLSARRTHGALDRGVVDGFGWTTVGPRQRGWLKKVKYVIDLPFYRAGNMVILMNLDRWKTLPAGVRRKVIAITAEFEPRMVAHYKTVNAAEVGALGKFGVDRIKFSTAENKAYLDAAYAVEWDAIARRVPATVATLRKLAGDRR